MNSAISPVDRFFVIFTSIVYEAMPFIIIGAIISGTLEELLPQRWITSLLPRRRWLDVAGSALLGLIFPMCECGIVPVMRRLLSKGLPLGCAVAYMLAAPIINPVVIGSTWAAFSGDRSQLDGLSSLQMVLLRTGMAFVIAFFVGVVVERLRQRHGLEALIQPVHRPRSHHHHHHHHEHDHGEHDHDHGHNPGPVEETTSVTDQAMEPDLAGDEAADSDEDDELESHVHDVAAAPEMAHKTIAQRIMSISETALHDFVDIACFLILGALLASVVQTFRWLDYAPEMAGNPVVASVVMMIMAVLLCLCSEADAFVAANLIKVPLAGKLGFLVLGPMFDIKLYLMYTRVFKNRLIWTIVPLVVASVFVLSLLAHYATAAFQTTG